MVVYGWAVRLLLFLVLLTAGSLKLVDDSSFTTSMSTSRLKAISFDNRLTPWLAKILASIEIVVGVALLSSEARWAALAATVLFVIFALYVLLEYLAGNTGTCACFGSAFASKYSAGTVLRNILFAAAAGSILLAANQSSVWEADLWVLGGSDIGLALISSILLIGLLLFLSSSLAVRTSNLGLVAKLKDGDAVKAGGMAALNRLLPEDNWDGADQGFLIVAISSRCEACIGVKDFVAKARERLTSFAGSCLVILHEQDGNDPPKVEIADPLPIVYLPAGALAEQFGILTTPSALVTDDEGRVQRSVVGVSEVVSILRSRMLPE